MQGDVTDTALVTELVSELDRLRDELGWRPEHADFEVGLRDTIDWYRANEAWWAPLKDRRGPLRTARAARWRPGN